MAVEAGRAAYESGLPAADYQQAIASSPLTSFLD
jgi:thiazole synthase ThiGH ThiG subunit